MATKLVSDAATPAQEASMALSAVAQNVVSQIMQESEDLVKSYNRYKELKRRFEINDVYNLIGVGDDLTEIATFAHLTQGEVGNAINALDAVIDAVETGGNLDALYLMKG